MEKWKKRVTGKLTGFFIWRIQQKWQMSYSKSQVHKCHLPMSDPCEENKRSDYWVTLYPTFTNVIFLCPIPAKKTTGVTTELLYIQGHKCHLPMSNPCEENISQVHKYRLSLSIPREEYNRCDFLVTLYSRSQMSSFFAQSPWRIQQEWLFSYSIFKVTNVTFLCSIPVKNTTGVTF